MLLLHLKKQRIKTKLVTLLEEKKKRLPILEGSTGGIKIVIARDNTPQETIRCTVRAFNTQCGY